MKDLFQVGKLELVDPEEVIGIVWDHGGNCRFPLVLLRSGHSVPADKYTTPARAGEEAREATILRLRHDLDKASWATQD